MIFKKTKPEKNMVISTVIVKFYDSGQDVPKHLKEKVKKQFGADLTKETDIKNRKFFFFFPMDNTKNKTLLGYMVVAKYGLKLQQKSFGVQDSLPIRQTKKLFNLHAKRILKMEHPEANIWLWLN